MNGLLNAIPPYFSQDVITADRRTATLAFGIRLMALAEQQRLIETMRSSLHPPAGVSAQPGRPAGAGGPVGAQVADPWRRLETLLVGLAAVALVLLIAFRGDRRRALVPLVPIVLATGWSALILFAVRVPLNPMSVTLGALVIAISTEFSVLLSERHRQERLAGPRHDRGAAPQLPAHRRRGGRLGGHGDRRASACSCSRKSAMLRDFGLVTLIDLSVSLLGVLVALPAALMIAERTAARGGPSMSPTGASAARARSVARSELLAHGRYAGCRRVVLVALDRALALNTILTGRAARRRPPGARLPPFAVPLALSDLNGDADVATRADDGEAGQGAGVQGARGAHPERLRTLRTWSGRARAVRRRRLLPAGPERDAGARAAFPRCALRRRGDQGRTRAAAGADARAKGLTFPVGIDTDGALAELYKVATCPQVNFAYPGGMVQSRRAAEHPVPRRPAGARERAGGRQPAPGRQGAGP